MEIETNYIETINDVSLYIRREDLIHPFVSGNKYRKLKYNLLHIHSQQFSQIVTFGGAHSNHIAAVAYAALENGLSAVGVIRGEELSDPKVWSPTLRFAHEQGMQFVFVSRTDFRTNKNDSIYWTKKYPNAFILPEGGTNAWAIKGCSEIIKTTDSKYDYIIAAVGTGGTLAGLIAANVSHAKILGFPILKGDFLRQDICSFANGNHWDLITGYEFGGYAKTTPELIQFINSFYQTYNIPLDPVYTGKAMFGVWNKIQSNYFPKGTKILFIHTGGLQGIAGMNAKLKKNGQPLIIVHE